jgi:hypothetical protein
MSFEAYLHIPVSKAEEGFTYVHCLFVVAGIGVEER